MYLMSLAFIGRTGSLTSTMDDELREREREREKKKKLDGRQTKKRDMYPGHWDR